MAKSITATEFGSCASKMGLPGTPWALPQPCQSSQGSSGAEDIHPKHILELLLFWSACWKQALLSSGCMQGSPLLLWDYRIKGRKGYVPYLSYRRILIFMDYCYPLWGKIPQQENCSSRNSAICLVSFYEWLPHTLITWKLHLLRFHIWSYNYFGCFGILKKKKKKKQHRKVISTPFTSWSGFQTIKFQIKTKICN